MSTSNYNLLKTAGTTVSEGLQDILDLSHGVSTWTRQAVAWWRRGDGVRAGGPDPDLRVAHELLRQRPPGHAQERAGLRHQQHQAQRLHARQDLFGTSSPSSRALLKSRRACVPLPCARRILQVQRGAPHLALLAGRHHQLGPRRHCGRQRRRQVSRPACYILLPNREQRHHGRHYAGEGPLLLVAGGSLWACFWRCSSRVTDVSGPRSLAACST